MTAAFVRRIVGDEAVNSGHGCGSIRPGRYSSTMPRLTPIAVLLLASVVPAFPQEPRLPTFSANDQLAAAKALCGDVSRGTVKDNIGLTPEDIKGFVAANKHSICVELLSASYAERGVTKHVIVFGEHYVDDEGVLDSGQGERATLHAAMFEHRSGKWTTMLKQTELAQTGFNGRDPAVALKKIGEDRHAFEIVELLWNAGSAGAGLSLYEPVAGAFAEILNISTSADDCGQHERCFKYESTLTYDEASNPNAFDLKLTLKGTYRNRAGRILTVPSAPFVFRFANGKYAPVLTTAARRAVWEATQSPW